MKTKAPTILVIKRLGQILWSFFKNLPKIFVSGPHYFASVAEELGGGVIKLAQILAMRYDMLPERYCREFSRLFDRVKPMSKEEVLRVFKEDLGKSPEEIFSRFSYEPYASASFGQVHRARFQNKPRPFRAVQESAEGTLRSRAELGSKIIEDLKGRDKEVAVKIQRPLVVELAKADIAIIKFLGRAADKLFLAPVSLKEVTREWESWTMQELDYKKELANTRRIKEESQNPYVYIPEVFPEVSTARMLVTEFIEGKNLNTLIREGVLLPPETRKKIARFLVRIQLWQYFKGGLYQADPHPGNVILMADGRLGYVDFGMTGESRDPYEIFHFANFLKHSCLKETKEAVGHIKNFMHSTLAVPVEMVPKRFSWRGKSPQQIEKGIRGFLEHKLGQVIIRWAEHVGDQKESLFERSSARHFLVLVLEARRFGLEVPTNFLAVVRAMVIVDMICLVICPEVSIREELHMFFQDHPEMARMPEALVLRESGKEKAPVALAAGREDNLEWEKELNSRMLERYLDYAGRVMERVLEEGSQALAYLSTSHVSILRDLM